jgi:hypothetical protein
MTQLTSFAVLNIATELSAVSMKREIIALDAARGLAIKTALGRAFEQCRMRVRELALPCAICKRPAALGHSVTSLAEEKLPIQMHYYDVPCCHASDACMKHAEALRHMLDALLPAKDAALHTCCACKKLELPSSAPFFPCPYCNAMYFCSLGCFDAGAEESHARTCRKRDTLPPGRFKVAYKGLLVLPSDAPGFALITAPDGLAPGDAHASATDARKIPAFERWFEMECTDRRYVLFTRLPPSWHCICGKACYEVPPGRAGTIALLTKEHGWTLTQLVSPACSDACATQATVFLGLYADRMVAAVEAKGDRAVRCSACAAWPLMGQVWKCCAACNGPAYCSRKCQVQAWPEHKKVCAPQEKGTE